MNKTQRNEMLLLKELNTRKIINIESAINLLGVSESTVRRLFTNLEQKGVCVRGHGSIRILDNDFTNIYVYESVENTGVAEKEIIADKALKLIKDGDVIFLDAGTTLAKLSAKIADALRDNVIHGITVFTNSLVNLNVLKDYVSVNVIGGEYRENRKDFCGMMAEMTITNICFDKCFLGTDGYTKDVGFTATDFQTARIAQLVIANSGENYILADSEKFRKTAGVCFAKAGDVTAVITNDAEGTEVLTEAGIASV